MGQESFACSAQIHRENIEPTGQFCLGQNRLFVEGLAALYVEVDGFKVVGLGKKSIPEDKGKTHHGYQGQAGYDFKEIETVLDLSGPPLCSAVFIKIFSDFFMCQRF